MERFDPIPLDDQQARHLKDAVAAWRRYLAAEDELSEVKGAMAWKTTKGRQYLVHSWYDRIAGTKRGTSLGPRSPKTERVKAAFEIRRAAAEKAMEEAKAPIERIARVGKALRLGRLDNTGAEILRELRRERVLGPGLYVIGSSAVAGYEARAAAFMPPGLDADPDGLDLCTILQPGEGMIDELAAVLRRVDPSFRRRDDGAIAVNERGFGVTLRWRENELDWTDQVRDFDVDQCAVLRDALVELPVNVAAISKNGMPLEMSCLDPRSFAILHYAKVMAGLEQGIERAYALGRLVERRWPEGFSPAVFDAFPEFADGVAPDRPRSEDPDVPEADEDMKFYGP